MESPKLKRLRAKLKDAEQVARQARTSIVQANEVLRRKQNEAYTLRKLISQMVSVFLFLLSLNTKIYLCCHIRNVLSKL